MELIWLIKIGLCAIELLCMPTPLMNWVLPTFLSFHNELLLEIEIDLETPVYKICSIYAMPSFKFTEWEIPGRNSHLVLCFRYGASMIAGLVSYHDWVGVQIVEDTLEHVRIGNLFFSKINFHVLLYFFKKNRIKKNFLFQVWKWMMPNTINDDWLWLNLWESYTIIASLTPLLSLRYELLCTTHIKFFRVNFYLTLKFFCQIASFS